MTAASNDPNHSAIKPTAVARTRGASSEGQHRPGMLRGLASLALLALCTIQTAHAQLEVEISGAGANQYPIAIADFADPDSQRGRQLADVVRADLLRSGLFRTVNTSGANLTVDSAVDFDMWRQRGANALAYGSSQVTGSQLDIRYRMVDTVQQTELDGMAFTAAANRWRSAAHKVAHRICEKLSGAQCAFSTRIAHVAKRGGVWELQIADADGHNPQTALRSRESIISPAWSPDGTRLAYV